MASSQPWIVASFGAGSPSAARSGKTSVIARSRPTTSTAGRLRPAPAGKEDVASLLDTPAQERGDGSGVIPHRRGSHRRAGPEDDRARAVGREKWEVGAVGLKEGGAVAGPAIGIPGVDPVEEGDQFGPLDRPRRGGGRQENQMPARDLVPEPDRLVGDSRVQGFDLARVQRPAPEDHLVRFPRSVDGPDQAVEPFQVVRPLDKSPLPAAIQVEVVDRRVAEVNRESTRLEPRQDCRGGIRLITCRPETDPARQERPGLEQASSLGDRRGGWIHGAMWGLPGGPTGDCGGIRLNPC